MTSLVQVAMIGECRRTSDCARCMQRGVDACYESDARDDRLRFQQRAAKYRLRFQLCLTFVLDNRFKWNKL